MVVYNLLPAQQVAEAKVVVLLAGSSPLALTCSGVNVARRGLPDHFQI
jgi:hypothetical protein